MNSERRAHNSKAPDVVRYAGADHVGPVSIYKAAKPVTAVSLATFSARFRRLIERNALSDANIAEALSLNADDFKRKYGARRTLAEVDGLQIDLLAYYTAHATDTSVDYRNFWQRIRALLKDEDLSRAAVTHALTLPADVWRSFYGGGRRKDFVYKGDEYPDQSGKRFHSVVAFLRTVERYDERDLIWSRLKAGWNLDDALAIPVTIASQRAGSIYRVIRRKTKAVYVGLTVTTVEQRWAFHVRRAMAGSTTKLHAAIREDGGDGFDIDVLEHGIKDPALLPAREAFWVERLSALGPMASIQSSQAVWEVRVARRSATETRPFAPSRKLQRCSASGLASPDTSFGLGYRKECSCQRLTASGDTAGIPTPVRTSFVAGWVCENAMLALS